MSRLIVTLVVLIAIVVAALVLLAGRASERPTARVEQTVELGNLAN